MKNKYGIVLIFIICFIVIFSIFSNSTFAAKSVLDENTESTLIEMKNDQLHSIKDYQEKYGSESYGTTAYILHIVQIWSIPFCFLGIVIGVIMDYVIGLKHLEVKEKGLALIVTFITLTVICQVLPLVFAIVVKFGRE